MDPHVREDDNPPSFPATTGNPCLLDPRVREDDKHPSFPARARHSRPRPGIHGLPHSPNYCKASRVSSSTWSSPALVASQMGSKLGKAASK